MHAKALRLFFGFISIEGSVKFEIIFSMLRDKTTDSFSISFLQNQTETTKEPDEIKESVDPSEEEGSMSHNASANNDTSPQETMETTDAEIQHEHESSEPKKSETNGTIPSNHKDNKTMSDDNSIAKVSDTSDINLDERWPTDWWTQYSTLTERAFRQNFSAVLTKIDLIRHIILGIVFGIFYFQLEHEEERLHDIRGVVSRYFQKPVFFFFVEGPPI